MNRFPHNDRLPQDRSGTLDYREIRSEEEQRTASGRWPLLQATDRTLRWQDRYPHRSVSASREAEMGELPRSNVVELHSTSPPPGGPPDEHAEATTATDSLAVGPR